MFESGYPHKSLFACLCVEVRVICFDFRRIVFGVAFFQKCGYKNEKHL